MSDFASLLGEFQKTAKKATAASQTKEETTTAESRKRQRPESYNSQELLKSRKKTTSCSLPQDYRQLHVRLAFLCIGAQKGGTTWLHETLQKCPQLSLPAQKELHFWDWHRRKGLGWFSRQFPKQNSASSLLFGEVTPCYMALPERDVIEIRQLFPSVRILFLARDLLDRAWSALLMELRNAVRGMEAGQFDVVSSDDVEAVDPRQLKKMEQESNPDLYDDSYFMDRLKHSTHSQRSDYATGLKRWLQHFPKEQLLILNYRDVEQHPKRLLKQTLNHIGVKDADSVVESLKETELQQKINAATGPTSRKTIRPSLRKQMEQYLKGYAQEFNTLLDELGYTWRLDDYS